MPVAPSSDRPVSAGGPDRRRDRDRSPTTLASGRASSAPCARAEPGPSSTSVLDGRPLDGVRDRRFVTIGPKGSRDGLETTDTDRRPLVGRGRPQRGSTGGRGSAVERPDPSAGSTGGRGSALMHERDGGEGPCRKSASAADTDRSRASGEAHQAPDRGPRGGRLQEMHGPDEETVSDVAFMRLMQIGSVDGLEMPRTSLESTLVGRIPACQADRRAGGAPGRRVGAFDADRVGPRRGAGRGPAGSRRVGRAAPAPWRGRRRAAPGPRHAVVRRDGYRARRSAISSRPMRSMMPTMTLLPIMKARRPSGMPVLVQSSGKPLRRSSSRGVRRR